MSEVKKHLKVITLGEEEEEEEPCHEGAFRI